jgi:hypothetical protein
LTALLRFTDCYSPLKNMVDMALELEAPLEQVSLL